MFEVPIEALIIGEITLRVTGRSGDITDVVERKLRVKVRNESS